MRIQISIIILIFGMLASKTIVAQGVAGVIAGGVKKIIKAVDLKIQREQNKVIWLQNAQKTIENAMSKLKLTEISQWTEKQRALYEDYFTELKKVKNTISTYKKVKSVVEMQVRLVGEYKSAWSLLSKDKNFTAAEKQEMYRIYSGMFDESLKNIDQLMLVTNSFTTQMSDGKRLELIDLAGKNMEANLTDLGSFNNRNFNLAHLRSRDLNQVEMIKKIYGLQ